MKNTIMIIIMVVLAIFGIAMYSKNVQLSKEIDLINEEFNEQSLIDYCIKSAYETYTEDWNTACRSLYLGDNCLLPAYKSDRIDTAYKEAQDRCIERYR